MHVEHGTGDLLAVADGTAHQHGLDRTLAVGVVTEVEDPLLVALAQEIGLPVSEVGTAVGAHRGRPPGPSNRQAGSSRPDRGQAQVAGG